MLSNLYYGNYVVKNDTTYRLSCGLTTQIKQGYLAFGYNHTISTSTVNYWPSKNFMVTGYGNSFLWAAFEIFDAANCSGSLSKVYNGCGVTAVEVNGINNVRYAIAGAYNKAVYFTTLDSAANVVAYISYPFPSAPSGLYPKPSKPVIVQSDIPNEYYICGSYEQNMYILNVNANGNIIWSSYYNGLSTLSPKDIMMDPYQSHRLIVVGEAVLTNQDKDAFFVSVDATNGAISNTKLFGTTTSDDSFRAVVAGAYINSNNGSGFVMSGYSENVSASAGTAWIIKLDQTGNIIWSNLIVPSTGTNLGSVDVIQRLNALNNYEYYSLLESSVGMQVVKLDDAGLPFQLYTPNGLNNEYVYNLTIPVCKPVNIGYINAGSPGNFTGFQCYGTEFGFYQYPSMYGSYITSCYFNGETNCYGASHKINGFNEGPGLTAETAFTKFGALDTCTAFLVINTSPSIVSMYQCGNLIPGGSNQRTTPSGEPLKVMEEEKIVGVFPNPVSDKTVITYASLDKSKVSIQLFDVAGKHILSLQPEAKMAGTYSQELDLSKLEIESGVYFLTITIDGAISKEKILYNK